MGIAQRSHSRRIIGSIQPNAIEKRTVRYRTPTGFCLQALGCRNNFCSFETHPSFVRDPELTFPFPILCSVRCLTMRRLQIATLFFATLSITSMGCRQTPGPSTAGSLPPGSLSPAAQSPTFNPFGGATRVTPPPSGTFAPQNPYIGGPPGQTNAVSGMANGFAAAPVPNASVVGSGVQPAGFVTADSGATQTQLGTHPVAPSVGANLPSGVSQTGFASAAPASRPVGAGGMPVNDLTLAPPPPGYRGTMQANPQPLSQTYQPSASTLVPMTVGAGSGGGPGAAAQPAFTPVLPPSTSTHGSAPAVNVDGFQQLQPNTLPQSGTVPQGWQRTGASVVPAAEVASHMLPLVPASTPTPAAVTTPEQTTPEQTTPEQTTPEQTTSGETDNDSSDLRWRRPGSQRF